jgi:hypothetical protein
MRQLKPVAWLVVAAVALCAPACDRENRSLTRLDIVAPSSTVIASIVPPVVRSAAGRGCPFATAFDLIIEHRGRSPLFLDQVTIRLLDGSSVGGSPVLMSAADLAARFGSTQLRPGISRRFGLQPRFGCESFLPRLLGTEIILQDGAGVRQTVTATVPLG